MPYKGRRRAVRLPRPRCPLVANRIRHRAGSVCRGCHRLPDSRCFAYTGPAGPVWSGRGLLVMGGRRAEVQPQTGTLHRPYVERAGRALRTRVLRGGGWSTHSLVLVDICAAPDDQDLSAAPTSRSIQSATGVGHGCGHQAGTSDLTDTLPPAGPEARAELFRLRRANVRATCETLGVGPPED